MNDDVVTTNDANIVTTTVYEKDGQWYWNAPGYGKGSEGPFQTKEQAEADLKTFLVTTNGK